MSIISRLVPKGAKYLFRGLREGDVALLAVGTILMLIRFGRRTRSTKVTTVTLKAGESVALRVTRSGADPVAYRIDA